MMVFSSRFIGALTVLLCTAAATTAAADSTVRGRLHNQFGGSDMCLDVVNGGPDDKQTRLAPCGNFSGQFWTVTAHDDGHYTFTTDFLGPGFCLDVVNGSETGLAPCGNFSGQIWRQTSDGSGGGTQLTQDFLSGMCLDTVNGGPRNNFVELRSCAHVSGQFWFLTLP
jgi:hypothetical protein